MAWFSVIAALGAWRDKERQRTQVRPARRQGLRYACAIGLSSPLRASLLVLAVVGTLGVALGEARSDSHGTERRAEVQSTASHSGRVAQASFRFSTRPPGSALPSGAECAEWVLPYEREPRPQNIAENTTRGVQLALPADAWLGFSAWRELATRVDGNFTGTTDEIIQWASCKWGFDEDVTRAQAYVESGWDQDYVGDHGHSVGLMQVKAAAEGTPHRYTWPHSRTSTAYNLDYALAWRRACYEGHFAEGRWLPAGSRGDLWRCIGLWYSGTWRRGDIAYVTAVRAALARKSWPGPEDMRTA